MTREQRRRTGLGVANLVAVLVIFFAVPVTGDVSGLRVLVDVLLTGVGLVVAGVILGREGRAVLRGQGGLRLLQLVLLFEVVVVLFGLAYYSLSVHDPDQMAGVRTRLDALYFTAATMSTVGYGDVHPVGQLARGLATLQLAFDVVFVAAFVRVFSGRVSQEREARSKDG